MPLLLIMCMSLEWYILQQGHRVFRNVTSAHYMCEFLIIYFSTVCSLFVWVYNYIFCTKCSWMPLQLIICVSLWWNILQLWHKVFMNATSVHYVCEFVMTYFYNSDTECSWNATPAHYLCEFVMIWFTTVTQSIHECHSSSLCVWVCNDMIYNSDTAFMNATPAHYVCEFVIKFFVAFRRTHALGLHDIVHIRLFLHQNSHDHNHTNPNRNASTIPVQSVFTATHVDSIKYW
jgi:hypothetical protein